MLYLEEDVVGLKKFVDEYNSSFKPISVLQEQVNTILEKHKLEIEQHKIESKRVKRTADDDGWITVEKSDRNAFKAKKQLPGAIVKKKHVGKEKVNKRAPVKII